MENKKAFLISTICVAISIWLVSTYVSKKRAEMTATFGEEVMVITAKTEIAEYAIIRAEMLEAVTVFTKFQQPQTVKALKDDEASIKAALSEIVGKASFVPIYKGEQITLTKLIHQDGKPVLDRQVEKKMRAVTVQISPQTGVGKMIRPGNHVDIMAIVNYEANAQSQFEVKTVFQNVLVLATGKTVQNAVPSRVNRSVLSAIELQFEQQRRKDFYNASPDAGSTSRIDDNYQNITVQLSPEDAEKFIFLQHTIGDSRLYFTLRNSADQTVIAKLDTTILDDVLGPDSNYGRGKVRTDPLPPSKPRFYDSLGASPKPVY